MASRNRKKTRLLGMEVLENRRMMAANNYLYLDFTPDSVPDRVQPATFASTFQTLRYTNGNAPRFLDFDGNRQITNNDVKLAALAIAQRTSQVFASSLPRGYNVGVDVRYGDVLSASRLGQRALDWGRQSANNYVAVMYVGGWSFSGETNVTGLGFQAPPGKNLEHYAYTFSTAVGYHLMKYKQSATPREFANEVASTIAHEAGHLMGLGHQLGHPRGGRSIMNYSADANVAKFTNEWYPAEVHRQGRSYYAWQNPYYELWNSLRNQPHTAGHGNYRNDIHQLDELVHEDSVHDHVSKIADDLSTGLESSVTDVAENDYSWSSLSRGLTFRNLYMGSWPVGSPGVNVLAPEIGGAGIADSFGRVTPIGSWTTSPAGDVLPSQSSMLLASTATRKDTASADLGSREASLAIDLASNDLLGNVDQLFGQVDEHGSWWQTTLDAGQSSRRTT